MAVSWQVYELTGSAFALGLIGLVQFVPSFALILAIGHTADRYDRRFVSATCQGIGGLVMATTAVGVATHAIAPLSLFAAIVLIGTARAFELPAVVALLPNLVTREQFPRAAANSTSASNVAAIAGPALGGFLYLAGPTVVYATAAGLMLVAATLLPLTRPVAREIKRTAQTLQTLFAGIAFVAHDRVVLGAITLDLFAVLMGGVTALLPIYARDVFATGPWGLGLLRSAPAAGALTMTLILGFFPLRRGIGTALFASVAAYGVVMIVFAVSHSFVLSLAALAAGGLFDAISRVIRATLVQLETPDDVRGRVSAVISLFTSSSGYLGQVESGFVAAAVGAVPSAIIGGIGSVLVACAWMGLFPELRRIDTYETIAKPAV